MMHVTAVVLAALIPFLPSPHDTGGWGLRVGLLSQPGPFLQCELFDHISIGVILRNFSDETREHDPLLIAKQTGALKLSIIGPDGKGLPAYGGGSLPRDPFTYMNKLRAGEWESEKFTIGGFAYDRLYDPGRYRMVATLKIDGKTITTPPVEFEVIKVPDDAVLVTHSLPRAEGQLLITGWKDDRAVVQQVRVGDRVWLVYRRFARSGTLRLAARIAELPGKVEMEVKGVYGGRTPVTVTYREPNSVAKSTTLKIHTTEGRLWRPEDEPQPPDEGSSGAVPALRPVKP